MRSIKLVTKYAAAFVILLLAFGPIVQIPLVLAIGSDAAAPNAPTGQSSIVSGVTVSNTCLTGGACSAADNAALDSLKSTQNSSADNQGQAAQLNNQGKNATGNPATQYGKDTSSCSDITSCLAWTIYWIGPGFASWVASISAYFFDYVVKISLNSTAYALGFLTTSWGLVLNLANMFFIFILIYTAFVIMLKAETTRTLQILAWVIAIALVVNFSFFFTRVVIDAGNILATQFYNGITAQPNIAGVTLDGSTGPNAPVDITRGMMQALGIEKPLTQQGFTNWQAATGNTNSAWSGLLVLTVVFLSTAVLFWMLAFGLAMIAIKFVLRVVGLWFVLIASPLAFVSKTLPKTQKFFEMWLQTLVGFSFYPAIFLFMFFVLNQFVKDLGNSVLFSALSSNANSAGSIAGGMAPASLISQLADVFIRMGFLIVMMYIMLKAADWLMEQTGGMASMIMNKASGAVLGAGFRTAANVGAFAGRNTVGRGAFRLADSATFKKFAGSSAIGNALWRGTSSISKATFDVRNAPGSSVLSKGVTKIVGDVNVGKATAKSFDKSVADREKQVKQRAESLKASETEKRNTQEKYERDNGEKHQNESAERKNKIAGRQKEIDRFTAIKEDLAKTNPKAAIAYAENKGLAKLLEEQKADRKAQEEAEKKFAKGGEDATKNAQKERITALANRVGTRNFRNLGMPSAGSVRGAVAAMKLVKEKSIADKFKELAKEANADEGGGEKPNPPAVGGGGATSSAHTTPGAGGPAFNKEAHTADALKSAVGKLTETVHEDFTKLRHEQHKTTEALHNIPTHTAETPKLPNTKKLVEQVSGGVAERLQENANIPINTRELKNTNNPVTGTQQLKDQNLEEKK